MDGHSLLHRPEGVITECAWSAERKSVVRATALSAARVLIFGGLPDRVNLP